MLRTLASLSSSPVEVDQGGAPMVCGLWCFGARVLELLNTRIPTQHVVCTAVLICIYESYSRVSRRAQRRSSSAIAAQHHHWHDDRKIAAATAAAAVEEATPTAARAAAAAVQHKTTKSKFVFDNLCFAGIAVHRSCGGTQQAAALDKQSFSRQERHIRKIDLPRKITRLTHGRQR